MHEVVDCNQQQCAMEIEFGRLLYQLMCDILDALFSIETLILIVA